VTLAASSDASSCALSGTQAAAEADVSLGPESFAALAKNGRLHGRKVEMRLNETLRLRVSVRSDQHDSARRWLLVYDGEPGEGVETIAMKKVDGIEQGRDRNVFSDWRPRRTGRHELTAVVLERRDDPVPGNNLAELTVDVKKGKMKRPAVGRGGR
jgi:hypothetical protein